MLPWQWHIHIHQLTIKKTTKMGLVNLLAITIFGAQRIMGFREKGD